MNTRAYAAAMRRCLVLLAALLSGCAHYQYDLLQPAADAGPVAGDDRRSFDIDPLRYTVATADDRLSIRIYNPTVDTIRLVGRASSVVDPADRSHPLIDQTIAAESYVIVVLPPLRPFGSTLEVGAPSAVPTVTPGGPTPVEQGNDSLSDDPGYDRASPVYWDWPGPGDARIHLAYRRADGSHFEHDLTVRRRPA